MKKTFLKLTATRHLFIFIVFLSVLSCKSTSDINLQENNEELNKAIAVTNKALKSKDLQIITEELLNQQPFIRKASWGDTTQQFSVPLLTQNNQVTGYLDFEIDSEYRTIRRDIIDLQYMKKARQNKTKELNFMLGMFLKGGYELSPELVILKKKWKKTEDKKRIRARREMEKRNIPFS